MTLPQAESNDGAIRWMLAVFALFLVIGVLPITAVGVASVLSDDSGEGSGAGATGPAVVQVNLSEFAIDGDLDAPAGPVTLQVTNDGTMQHDLTIDALNVKTPLLDPGETAELELGVLEKGSYEVFCSVPGHRQSGMTATLNVGVGSGDGAGAVASDGSHDDHVAAGGGTGAAGDGVDYAAIDHAMHETMLAYPAETEGRGNQLLEPTIAPDGTKEFQLTAAVTPWEVEPGKMVDAWTYNGMVPGPEIRLNVGDHVRVTIKNDLPLGTDIHWHGVTVPNNQDGVAPYTQDIVEAGQSYTYEFTASKPMVGMYHAHHAGNIAVPNGLFAPLIVGDMQLPRGETVSGVTVPADLQVAQELPMVLNDAGVIGLSINGKSFPATEPIMVNQGDWILVHYYNEGLQAHPMHLHGVPQLVVAKDGIPLDQPYFADTINVAPGERYSVLVHATDAGTWVWHCHILNHVERDTGMFGMVTALVVKPAA
jgi:uncharacterized cupredoxin-like copper-binding protein